MTLFIVLALLNGLIIGTLRLVNGKLCQIINPFWTSFWVFSSGFMIIMIYLILKSEDIFIDISQIPFFAFLGGVSGVVYATINSYIFSKLGSTLTTLLVISGQMISGALIDMLNSSLYLSLVKLIGIILIIVGIYIKEC